MTTETDTDFDTNRNLDTEADTDFDTDRNLDTEADTDFDTKTHTVFGSTFSITCKLSNQTLFKPVKALVNYNIFAKFAGTCVIIYFPISLSDPKKLISKFLGPKVCKTD